MNQICLDDTIFTNAKDKIKFAIEKELSSQPSFLKFINLSENKDGSVSIKAKSYLVAKIVPKPKSINLEFRAKYLPLFPQLNAKTFNKEFSRVVFSSIDEIVSLSYTLSEIAIDILSEVGGENFGCCSRYEACSDAKQCIHPDKLFARACSYRRNLEQGRIFYGKNRTT